MGADRIAANGDTANKVGTYPLAVLAARHGVPFYVVAPTATLDGDAADGSRDHRRDALGRPRSPPSPGVASRRPAPRRSTRRSTSRPRSSSPRIVTEAGVLARAVRPGHRGAIAAREARRPAPPPGPMARRVRAGRASARRAGDASPASLPDDA